NETDITALQTSDTSFDLRVTANETDITNLETEVASHRQVPADPLSSGLLFLSSTAASDTGYWLPAGIDGQVLTTSVGGTPTWVNLPDSGDVTGPGSSTEFNLASFGGIDGNALIDSGIPFSLITDNESNISSNAIAIGTNTTNISTNIENIAANATATSDNAGNISTNTTGIAANDTDISINVTDIAANVTAIGNNTTTIDANGTSISSNTGRITDNETNITALETSDTAFDLRVTANETDITNLETEVDSHLQVPVDPGFSGRLLTSSGVASGAGTWMGDGTDGQILVTDGAGVVSWLSNLFNITTVDYLTGAATPVHKEGRVFYHDSSKSLSYMNDVEDMILDLGQELVVRVVNKSGVDIPNGSAVRVNGSQGQKPTIVLAQADTVENAVVAGISTHDILNGAEGYITTYGVIRDVNFGGGNSFTEGDVLYLSDTVPGGYTITPPAIKTKMGMVVNDSPTKGEIIARIESNMISSSGTNSGPIVVADWATGTEYKQDQINIYNGHILFRARGDYTSGGDVEAHLFNGDAEIVAPPPLATGVTNGGEVTLSAGNVSVTGGKGIVASYTEGLIPEFSYISWVETSSFPDLDLSKYNTIYVEPPATRGDPGVVKSQTGVPPVGFEYNYIVLGLVNPNLDIARSFRTFPADPLSQTRTLSRFLGILKKGMNYSGNTDLTFTRSQGGLHSWGVNWGPENPNKVDFDADDEVIFKYALSTGIQSDTDTDLDNTQYDDGGTLVDVGSKIYTYQRVYQSFSGEVVLLYGQSTHRSESWAIDAISKDVNSLMVPEELSEKYTWVGTVVLSKDVDDSTSYTWLNCGIFGCGEAGGTSAGGTSAGGGGDVFGPPSSATNTVALFADSGGKTLISTNYALPVDDGTATYVLQTDGAGNVTWVAPG
ncbi:MAG: hypothetical protein DRQ44_16895, partial [Gammaproteobacteria bacterium]